jgi:hypothetical protein
MDDDEFQFKKVYKDVLDRHSQLFQALAPYDTLEYDIAQYILQHKEGLQDKISHLYKPSWQLFPDSIQDIYLEQYEQGVLSILRDELKDAFQLDPEMMQTRISTEFIKKIASDLLIPPN